MNAKWCLRWMGAGFFSLSGVGNALTNLSGTLTALDGIGMEIIGGNSDAFSRGFVTPRHFLFGHLGAWSGSTQLSIGGQIYDVSHHQWLSSPELVANNMGFGIAELDREVELPGFKPLLLATSGGEDSNFEGLHVMAFGQHGFSYGIQVAESRVYEVTSPPYLPNEAGWIHVPVVGSNALFPLDRFLFTNVEAPQVSKLEGGDSNSPLLVQTEAGLAILGTALGYTVFSGSSLMNAHEADINVYNLAEHYLPGIQNYLDTRNAVQGTSYALQVVVVPEASTFTMVGILALCALLHRNRA